jgi:ABC-type glycerol-3-phosphate transport system permease component
MATESIVAEFQSPPRRRLTLTQRKRLLVILGAVVMAVYTAITIFPFYVMFVNSFVNTKDASDLNLWIPKAEELSLEAQIGNLSVFYNLDMSKFKEDMGIPPEDFLMSRTSLRKIAEQYSIPEERMNKYFAGYYTYNGWITLLQGDVFWPSLIRTILLVVASLVGITLLSIFTGYGLTGLKRRDQMFIYNLYLLQMVIPPMLIILPQFIVVQWLLRLFPGYSEPGTMRSALQYVGLIMINIKGWAFTTMIMTSAISAIPRDLQDSAQIDGASHWQYIRYVLFPLLKVPIASLIVIMLPIFWNQFLEPYVYLDQNASTLLPFVYSMQGEYRTNFQMQYATLLASIVPLAVVYLIFRRFFIQGVMAGAIKG